MTITTMMTMMTMMKKMTMKNMMRAQSQEEGLGGHNDKYNDDEEGAVILTRVTTNSQGDCYMAKAIGRVALGLMMQEGHCETAFAEINQNF